MAPRTPPLLPHLQPGGATWKELGPGQPQTHLGLFRRGARYRGLRRPTPFSTCASCLVSHKQPAPGKWGIFQRDSKRPFPYRETRDAEGSSNQMLDVYGALASQSTPHPNSRTKGDSERAHTDQSTGDYLSIAVFVKAVLGSDAQRPGAIFWMRMGVAGKRGGRHHVEGR